MGESKIEWTDESSNPFEILFDGEPVKGWFCTKVSPGCANCYSERINNWVGNRLKYSKSNEGRVTVRLKQKELERISNLREPKRIFMFDMTDLFHSMFSDDFVFVIFDFIREHPQHTFQVLTKREERMHDLVHRYLDDYHDGKPLPNVWLMVSVEDQERANERIPWLLRTPAVIHGVSCEPLLGEIDLGTFLCEIYTKGGLTLGNYLDWVVVGGESGRGARPMHPGWVRSLRDQCQAVEVAFFIKQWGAWEPIGYQLDERDFWHRWPDGQTMDKVGKKAAGRKLDGMVWDEFPDSSQCQ